MTTLGGKPPNPATTYAGSSDTTRYPGFRSAPDTSGVGNTPAPPPPAALPSGAPASPAVAPATPSLTPGMQAALAGGLNLNHSHNATPLQDIAGALSLGRPISDASWAKAGYGPGGAALPARTATVTGTTPLSNVNYSNSYSAAFPQPTNLQSANQALGGNALSRISSAFTPFR